MQKSSHESACKNSSFGFDMSSGTASETCDDANRRSEVSACGSGGAHLFVEACCGCALLSSCVAKVGFEVMPIDFEGNKHRPYVHVIQLDLRKPETWDFLRYVARSRRPFHFHFAPPCGTASRARDYPMAEGYHGPPPLRSEQWPLGFPWLNGIWAAKVESANTIYLEICSFCEFLATLNITWSIENPEWSYLWYIDAYKRLALGAIFVGFDSCFHGGERKKATALLTNLPALEALAGRCTGDHEHLEWGYTRTPEGIVFDTSKEAAYPRLLCERFAMLLSMQAGTFVSNLNPSMSGKDEDPRVATHKQPRGRKVPALVSEFETTKTIRTRLQDCPKLDDKNRLTTPFYDIPVGSKLLRRAPVNKGKDMEKYILWVFGIFRDAGSFLMVARSVMHPFDSFRALPAEVLRVVCNILMKHPLQTMKKRLEKLQEWRNISKRLAAENERIFASMDSGCAAVLKGKNLALLKHIADDIHWPDADIHEEIRRGFKLVGMQKPTGIFDPDVKPRTLSEHELIKQSRHLKPALWSKVSKSSEGEHDSGLWELTMEEVKQKRWLDGPYSFEELECMFEGIWNPVRRFGVMQRNKLRAIDDFSESGVNSSFAYLEKIHLKALDETVWIACCFVKHCLHCQFFDFELEDGERLAGEVNRWWKDIDLQKPILQTKTVDLKSAYKQFAISPEDRRLSVLALKRPGANEACGFISRTLPFGSTASVLHFNRASRLLHRIGLELDIAWTNYYDDYPVIEFSFLAANTTSTLRALTSLLGFECSFDKELPFATEAEMLGVVLDLSETMKGKVVIRNKESRMAELAANLEDIICVQSVEPKKLPSMFGRALFVESQISGRQGKLALADLRELERSKKLRVRVDDLQLAAFNNLLERYRNPSPRVLFEEHEVKPVLLFTDGACEVVNGKMLATVGAVIFHPDEKLPRAYGCTVSERLLTQWHDADKVHPVSLTELYALCVARGLWKRFLNNTRTIIFIDNQGVLDACIRGWSPENQMKQLLFHFELLDGDAPCIPWFARVPSISNCADYPSRGLWSKLKDVVGEFILDQASCCVSSTELDTLTEPVAWAEELGES